MELEVDVSNTNKPNATANTAPITASPTRRRPKRRKRKSTLAARREEVASLRDELLELRAQLAALGQPEATSARETVAAVVREQQLAFTGLRSLLSEHWTSQRHAPAYEPIHLPLDPAKRRAVLMQCSARKIRDARRFVLERASFQAATKQHCAVESFESDGGDLCSIQFDVTLLPRVGSVRRVFDALKFFAQNVEIYATERMGALTIREDDDVDALDALVSQRRLVSTNEQGVVMEANVALFRQYFPQGSDPEWPGEHAVVTVRPVDSDKLYPYVPSERVRHDLTGMTLVSRADPSDGADSSGVTVTRWIFFRTHRDEHNFDEATILALRKWVQQWKDLMIDSIREQMMRSGETRGDNID